MSINTLIGSEAMRFTCVVFRVREHFVLFLRSGLVLSVLPPQYDCHEHQYLDWV